MYIVMNNIGHIFFAASFSVLREYYYVLAIVSFNLDAHYFATRFLSAGNSQLCLD